MTSRGRLLLGVLLAAAGAAAVVAALTDRWVAAWARAGVPALDPPFADTRAYTTAWECARRGLDPFVANPCDPWGRALVPPRLPVELSFLGLGESATVPIAIALIALFAVCLFVVAGPLSLPEGLLYAAIVLSPSILLGIERANTDLLVFALLTLVLVTFRSPSGWRRGTAYAALVFAATIKLYPVFAAGVLLRQAPRRAAVGLAAVLVPVAVYALVTVGDLRASVEDMTRSERLSWGAGVVSEGLGLSAAAGLVLSAVGVAAGVGLSIWLALRLGAREPSGEPEARAMDAFWIGACVYLGTFVVGNNFDYKLVCLLFTVPQLLRWARDPSPRVPRAGWALAVLVAALWLSAAKPIVPGLSDVWLDALDVFPFDELLTWGLFVYLATALWLTLPAWLVRAWSPGSRADARRAAAPSPSAPAAAAR